MILPPPLDLYFQDLESTPLKIIAERVVYSNLATFIEKQNIPLTADVMAELTAFEFMENFTGKPSVWNTYYQPLIHYQNGELVHQGSRHQTTH
ncbi:hypothetical protein [Pedobacter suwonensis]|uniref:hypothetical protein n=1 Tax=Pedobacter suwonensis TaxID=332999 RepID=UPI0036A9A494